MDGRGERRERGNKGARMGNREMEQGNGQGREMEGTRGSGKLEGRIGNDKDPRWPPAVCGVEAAAAVAHKTRTQRNEDMEKMSMK